MRIAAAPHRLKEWCGTTPDECDIADILSRVFDNICSAEVEDALMRESTEGEWVECIRTEGPMESGNAPCMQVARFFQRILGTRRKTLMSLTPKRADAQTGMASLTETNGDEVVTDD